MRLLLLIAVAATLAGAPAHAADNQAAWWLSAIGADKATPPGPGVPLTVIDRGLDTSLSPFAGRPNTVLLNAQTPDTRTAALASLVLAVYPRVQLQLWDASPSGALAGYSEAIGIEAAAAHCPGVIDLPFSTTTPDPFVQTAILIAVHNGCLVVGAAGDGRFDGNHPQYPGDFAHVLTVAATTQQGSFASYSTSSPNNDLSAPGDSLPSIAGPASGTGYASAIVAAAAAWVWTQRPKLDASQVFALLRSTTQPIGTPGWNLNTGFGLLDVASALSAPAPRRDPGEPNDDIEQIIQEGGYGSAERPLTTPRRPSGRIWGTIDSADDPNDIYPIWVPPHSTVRIAVRAGGNAAGRIWGPKTLSVREGLAERRRDLEGQSISAGSRGFTAYAEVLLTGRVPRTSYVLVVTAARQ